MAMQLDHPFPPNALDRWYIVRYVLEEISVQIFSLVASKFDDAR